MQESEKFIYYCIVISGMELNTTCNDLGVIKTLFDAIDTFPKDGIGTSEMITEDGRVYLNPSWKEVQSIYKQYGEVTIKYNRPE